jgi:hypothetical protein
VDAVGGHLGPVSAQHDQRVADGYAGGGQHAPTQQLKFASAETPPALRAGFDEFVSCFHPDNKRRELFAEVVWSALHGIALLSESGRVPPDGQEERLAFLVTQIAGAPPKAATP